LAWKKQAFGFVPTTTTSTSPFSLQGADLTGANLTDARVTSEQLDTARTLEGATMADESKHD